jgi:hypothetical protein
MADLNVLLEQAAAEAEKLGGEAVRAQESVSRLGRLAVGLAAGVETGASQAQLLLDHLAARLAEAEAELSKESIACHGTLRDLAAAAARLRGDTATFLERAEGQLEALRQDKGRVLTDVDGDAQSAAAALTSYTERVRALEAATDARVTESTRAVEALAQQADDVRRRLAARGDALLAQLHYLEESARYQMHVLMLGYDGLIEALQEQAGAIQVSAKSLSDQAVAETTRRLAREALDTLHDSAKPLRKVMEELLEWGKRGHGNHRDRFDELGRRLQDVTRVLEGLKPPLDQVRQQLH